MSEDVLRRYPGVAEHPLAMALMCAPLIDRGCHDDAYTMGAAALALAPEDAAVREIVRRTLSASVPAFHLDMLHDTMRNACYAAAIARLVTPGMRVLEIGTGAGLLAMLAARAGAEVVTWRKQSDDRRSGARCRGAQRSLRSDTDRPQAVERPADRR